MCTCVVSPLSFTQGFSSFVPDYSFELFAGDKNRLFTLFLLLLPFLRANRGLVVNSSTGAHLSLAPGSAKRRLADCMCGTWRHLRTSWGPLSGWPLSWVSCCPSGRRMMLLTGIPAVGKKGEPASFSQAQEGLPFFRFIHR